MTAGSGLAKTPTGTPRFPPRASPFTPHRRFADPPQPPALFPMQNNSISPSESLRASEKHRSSADYNLDSKKRKAEEKDSLSRYVSLQGAGRPLFPPGVCEGEGPKAGWAAGG